MFNYLNLTIKKAVLITIGIFAVAFVLGFSLKSYIVKNQKNNPDFNSLNQIYDILRSKFDGNLDATKLLVGSKKGLATATGDPYTTYLTAQEANDLNNDLNGTISGIGAEIGFKNFKLVIIAPLPNTPASRAKLRAGDQIIKIDGQDATGYTLEEAVSKIRGPRGTTVELTLIRGTVSPFEITITRDTFTVASVKFSMKPNHVGYIQISRFGTDTANLLDNAIVDLKGQGATKFIIDLRDDPGGYLDQAIKVASEFLSTNQLIVEEKKDNKITQRLLSESGGKLIGIPVIVLINGGSASASEIVAGALQDQKAARILGEKSFGKGSVQEIIKLSDGSELKVTVAHWYTPSGKSINNEGIKPDIEISPSTDSNSPNDLQLEAALKAF